MSQTIADFIAKNAITMTSEPATDNPNIDASDWHRTSHHYVITLKMGDRKLSTYFTMGSAHVKPPSAEGVLNCLALDSAGIENTNGDFGEWASVYGYEDVKKAWKLFKTCQVQADNLKTFIGNPDLYQELLFETESL